MSIGTIIAGVAFTIAVVNWITHPDTWKSNAQKEVENLAIKEKEEQAKKQKEKEEKEFWDNWSTEQKDIKGN
ncbi:hypothetical protein B5M19_02530 [Mesomycoplasma hyopneumoniae]|uniref:hypothetical protein n=1 Tax=Mesomycoplasma TaxID=2923352 RepID=UPI0002F75469|nr:MULTISPECIES: hypothetical protein [Mesomycoplasma]OWY73828.1 hypothetical protein B5M19_02530 [Mesomycoplasma hyopneumoniae]